MLTSCCSLFSPPKEEGDILKLVITFHTIETIALVTKFSHHP